MDTLRPHLHGNPLPLAVRDQLAWLVAEHGERAVCDRLRIARTALARALAGLGLRRGTIFQIEAALREVPL
jgi:hypothetical protein